MNNSGLDNKHARLLKKFDQLHKALDHEINALKSALSETDDSNVDTYSIKKVKYYNDQLFSYQIWVGELGKIITDLTIELNHYKGNHIDQKNNILTLDNELRKQTENIKNLNEKLKQFSLLRRELNQLYGQFYLLKEKSNSFEKLGIIRLRSNLKRAILSSKTLSKIFLLLKATFSLNFKGYINRNRLFKKYEWEVIFIKNSNAFDFHYYLSKYSDVQPLNTDPVWHYVVYGWKEGRSPNQIFDSAWYLHTYEDIRKAGINPFIHYLQKGIIEKRRPNPNFNADELNVYLHGNNYIDSFTSYLNILNSSQGQLQQNEVQILSSDHAEHYYQLKQIVYISGLHDTVSHQLRVTDQLNILKSLNYSATCIQLEHIDESEHLLVFCEIIVLYRVPWSEKLNKIIKKCRKAGVIIVYDTDDFVFDPTIANEKNVDGIRFLSDKEKRLYHEGVLRYRTSIENCDLGIFSTAKLAEAYSLLNKKKSFIIKNGFPDYFLEASARVLRQSQQPDDLVIGYASGSMTHQKDFSIASKAIGKVLKKYNTVRLRILGFLEINEFPELLIFKDRIDFVPATIHKDLPYELAKFSINIAPLEVGNPFCEAKSALKYFDAALVRVPTIASATEPYKEAIQNGRTGYIAHNEEEWLKYLDLLISNSSHRSQLANNAYKDSIEKYSYEGKKKEVQKVFEQIYEIRKQRWDDNKLSHTITFVMPEMSKGSGGHSKIISIAKLLSGLDHSITLNFIGNHADYPDPLMIEKEFDLNISNIRATYTQSPNNDSNIIFATFWKTVYYIENSKNKYKKRFHLLQDYEPYFYSMGTDYLLSINSMKKNFKKISYGPWVKNIIKTKHSINADSMSFYYNKHVYFDNDSPRKDNVIVFFARPEMPRRCFDLGWKALKIYRERYGDKVEIVIFGSYTVEHISIGFKHTNLNVKPPAELASLYRSSTVGIAFSPTNPSMVPFEMMACGLPVLDLDVEGNEINYGGRDNVFLVNPDESEIANTIHEILTNRALRESVAEKGKQFIQKLPDELDAVYELDQKIVKNE